ncbi:MAG: (2Fe-2S)-binding protein [Phycisphaerales bacterium]|nr:(2Fe-2S)-binding protein [Phycisphaerales bacterium]
MQPEDHVCLCYHVSLRKLTNYARRERPAVASQLSDCLGAGTGCGWCRPYLQIIFDDCRAGRDPQISDGPGEYAIAREAYRAVRRAERAAARAESSPDVSQAE